MENSIKINVIYVKIKFKFGQITIQEVKGYIDDIEKKTKLLHRLFEYGLLN